MILCLVLATTATGAPSSDEKSAREPLVLLEGMVSAREQIPPSRLWVRVISTGPSHNNDFQYVIEFEGERRFFARSKTITSNVTIDKILFDGKEVSVYNDSGISLNNLGSEEGHVILDPRILGLASDFTGTQRLDWFKYGVWKDCKPELAGEDIVNGLNTWHVRLGDADAVFNWWIDEKNGFRVYRYVEDAGKMGHNDVRSYYGEAYPWLPTNTVLQRFNGEGSLICKVSFTIFKSQADVKFPDSTWTLAGMGIPTNTIYDIPVTDLRVNKVIGYWNGQRIRPFSEPSLKKVHFYERWLNWLLPKSKAGPNSGSPPGDLRALWGIGCGLSVMAVLGIFLFVRWRRGS